MKIKSLKLRGAIGIKKGLGLDEIEIDFSKFSPGLIALTGRNGSGKTTIMENLHPYRMMVSRDGSLQGHFFLKDSCRILSFEYEGAQYESKILIDAVTGGSEAYLYKDGTALNDGKLTTYDEVLQRVLGSPELFFNSVFCGQKAKGVAELKPADRRALFYELLNLNIYQAKCDAAKDKLKEQQILLSRAESDIFGIQEKVDEFQDIESDLENLGNSNDGLQRDIDNKEAVNKEQEEKIRELEINIAILEGKQRQNEQIESEISDKETAIKTVNDELTEELQTLATQEQEKINEVAWDQKYSAREAEIINEVQKLENEISSKTANCKSETDKLNRSIMMQQSGLGDIERLTERYQRLADNRGLIAGNIREMKRLRDLIDLLLTNSKEISSEQAAQASRLNEIQLEKSELTSEHDGIMMNIKQLDSRIEQLQKEIDRITVDTLIISEVPCQSEIGESCRFLKNAYDSKNQLPDLERTIESLNSRIAECKAMPNYGTYVIEKKVAQLAEENKKLEDIKFRAIETESKLEIARKELAELEKGNWENLEKEASEAEAQLQLLNEKKVRLNEQIERTREDVKRVIEDTESAKVQMKEKITSLTEEAVELDTEQDRKIEEIRKAYTEKREYIQVNTIRRVEEIKASIELLKSKIEPDVLVTIGYRKDRINELKTCIEENRCLISYWKEALQDNLQRIGELKIRLENKKETGLKLEKLLGEKAAAEQEIKDWSFLTRAFDKTGIPVLKLENSGIEITALANELLSIFDNKFRIVIETTRLKANKKDLKETFDINVIEDDGMCEISNKSGGQQVWLETAIQLAISRVVRQQGRNIQTSFLDEKDGALDLENAYAYYEMLQKNHELSGVYNTFVITHRPELLDYIPQQVKLKDGILEIQN